jgi:5'-phosphate synthase pdxT subunit
MPHSRYSSRLSGNPVVGLLAFQGAFEAHGRICAGLGAHTREIRTPAELEGCTHLILPGGESTTFLKLLDFAHLTGTLSAHAEAGKPILGTCAGLIVLARVVKGPPQKSLSLMDVVIERNAYGRQVDSFETDLSIPNLGSDPFHGVFIRSPIIRAVGDNVETLASHNGYPVFVRQGSILGTTFHPELTGDTRLHEFFLSLG